MLRDGDQERQRGRLFISYSRRDKAQVYSFVGALANAGIDVWIDREEIDPLDDFPARIRDGLASCHALLAWYSPEYAQPLSSLGLHEGNEALATREAAVNKIVANGRKVAASLD
jgi:hypothetical protein